MIIGEDGGCGSILEHSAGDGPAAIASNIFTMDLVDRSVRFCSVVYSWVENNDDEMIPCFVQTKSATILLYVDSHAV